MEGETGIPYQRYLATRWLSKYKVMKQLMDLFGDVEPFLEEVSVSPVTVEKLLSILRNPREEASLDGVSSNNWCRYAICKATYNLKEDGPLVLNCYDTITWGGLKQERFISSQWKNGHYCWDPRMILLECPGIQCIRLVFHCTSRLATDELK